jgi:hypothetical protein
MRAAPGSEELRAVAWARNRRGIRHREPCHPGHNPQHPALPVAGRPLKNCHPVSRGFRSSARSPPSHAMAARSRRTIGHVGRCRIKAAWASTRSRGSISDCLALVQTHWGTSPKGPCPGNRAYRTSPAGIPTRAGQGMNLRPPGTLLESWGPVRPFGSGTKRLTPHSGPPHTGDDPSGAPDEPFGPARARESVRPTIAIGA